jgi:hypothetical protein
MDDLNQLIKKAVDDITARVEIEDFRLGISHL